MNKIKTLTHSIQSKLVFHGEKLGLLSARYPRKMLQKVLYRAGLWFEVHNIGEANRVRFLDDEEEFLGQLITELVPQDVFFDIGACIGLFAIHAAKICKNVIAFEPEPQFREHLTRNIAINSLRNISVLPYAVSDRSGTLKLFTDGTNGKSPSLDNNSFRNEVEVETRTISELVLHEALPCPTVIKMDIEGAEILALRGMQELLVKDPPRLIYLEIHPVLLTHFSSSASEVLSVLERAGYYVQFKSQRDEQFHYVFALSKE